MSNEKIFKDVCKWHVYSTIDIRRKNFRFNIIISRGVVKIKGFFHLNKYHLHQSFIRLPRKLKNKIKSSAKKEFLNSHNHIKQYKIKQHEKTKNLY